MVRNIAFLMIVTLLILACSTSEKYDKQLNTWVGKSEQSLVMAWGRPSAVKYVNDNTKIFTYTKINDFYFPSEYYLYNEEFEPDDTIYAPLMNEYNFTPYAQLTDNVVETSCQTSFIIKNNVVSAWKWRGNDCVSD